MPAAVAKTMKVDRIFRNVKYTSLSRIHLIDSFYLTVWNAAGSIILPSFLVAARMVLDDLRA
jgi:hypothetical protein